MRGAKPKQNAIRRGLSDSYGLAKSESVGVSMPEDIRRDPVQSEIWAWIAPPTNSFSEQDVPTLRLLTYWHAVAQQAEQAIHSEDGRINIFDKIGVKPYKSENGKDVPLVRVERRTGLRPAFNNGEHTVRTQFWKARGKGTSKLLISCTKNHAPADDVCKWVAETFEKGDYEYIDEVLVMGDDGTLTRMKRPK